jgi:hypothetical protein
MQAVVCAKINKTNTIRKNKRRNNYDTGIYTFFGEKKLNETRPGIIITEDIL